MSTPIPAATVGDLLATSLRALYLEDHPGPDDAARVRVRGTPGEPPLPRWEIRSGTPARVPQMDATSRVPVELDVVTSLDGGGADALHYHSAAAAEVWWRGLSARTRPGPLGGLYLHAWLIMQPVPGDGDEVRERVTTLRAEAVVTLTAPAE